jgi:hypothetical protein
MAVVTVTPTVPVPSGAALPAESAVVTAGTDSFSVRNSGSVLLLFHATTANARTGTVVTTATVAGLAVADQPVPVVASGYNVAGPFPVAIYGNPLTVTVDNVDLTVRAIEG